MMVRSYDYSRIYNPSAPVLDVGISRTLQGFEVEIHALVDTGADATILPIQLIQQISAKYIGIRSMRGVIGISQRVETFQVIVRVGNYFIPGIRAVADKQGNEAILGRDVLNQLILTLNGPALTTEIQE